MPALKNYIPFGLTKDDDNFRSQAQGHAIASNITTVNSKIN
ncbi:hypothetical protein [Nostoc sp. KVJ3]|nr:hypothetical protein [Nostoc sp. KVJ3]